MKKTQVVAFILGFAITSIAMNHRKIDSYLFQKKPETKQLSVPMATPVPKPFDLDELKGRMATNGKVLIVCSKDQKFAVVVFLDTLVVSQSENGCAQDQ